MRTTWIYGLRASDRPDEIRYIGVSVDPDRRLRAHKSSSDRTASKNWYKNSWIRSVVTRDAEVEVVLLAEFGSEHEAYASEDSFITRYIELGHKLTNLSVGGRGGVLVPENRLEEFYAKRAESHRTPEFRARQSEISKNRFSDPDVYNAHVQMVREVTQTQEFRDRVSEGLRNSQKVADARDKANATRRLPENREKARIRSKENSSTEEALERSRKSAKKRWDNTPPEQRVAWNKGLKTACANPDKMVTEKEARRAGSREHREHLRETTLRYFETLKADPERYSEYLEQRAKVGAGNSASKAADWANLSDEARAMRGRNMSMGKLFASAKRKGLALELFPVVSGEVQWHCINLDGKKRRVKK